MLKFLKSNIATGVKILLFIVVLALLYMLTKSTLSDTAFFKSILIGYARSIASVLHFLFGNVQFDEITGNIIYKQHSIPTISGLAIKFYAIAFAIIFFFPRKTAKTFLVFLIASAVFYVLSLLRFVNDLFTPANLSSFFFSIILGLRYLTVYIVLKYKIGLHSSLTNYFNKIDVQVQSAFHFSFHKLLIIIALVPAFTGFFDWFLIAKWNYFVTAFSYLILSLSNALLWLLGFGEAYVYGNYILLDNYWLYLGTNCLGVGLMVVFSSLIFAIRSPLANRIVFVLAGLIILIGMNAVRIVGILLYITLNKIPKHLIEDYHNMSNNFFYLIVFIIILFYINKFQYIDLDFNKKMKDK
jgi:exosortase/archaeosortase family protein